MSTEITPASTALPTPAEPLYAVPPKLEPPRDDARDVRAFFGVPPIDTPPPAPATSDVPHGTPPGDPAPAPAAPAPGTPAAAPAPAAPTPPARPPRSITEEIADATAKRLAATQAAQPPPEAPPEPSEPDPETQLRLDALAHLQKHPRFKGRDLVGEYKAYEDKLAQYQKTWEQEHPGEQFDADDSAHDAWQEANTPEDLEDGIIATAELSVLNRRDTEARLESDRREAMRGPIENLAEQSRAIAAQNLMSIAAGGKQVGSFEELRAENPEVAYLVKPIVETASQHAAAVAELLTPGTPIKPDPNNPIHAAVMKAVDHYEHAIMAIPAEQRLDGYGRPYVEASRYDRMSPLEQQRCWTFRRAPDEVHALLIRDAQIQIQTGVKEHEAWKASRQKPAEPAPAPAKPAPAPLPPPANVPTYIRPPAGGTGPATTVVQPRVVARSFFDDNE